MGREETLCSSFAKRFAAANAMQVTTDAVQILGGDGQADPATRDRARHLHA
jgi:alkylation response protein AidB-like acyl-CoA dehydrogenase